MSKDKAIKVLIAKPGLDGHNRGARMLTLALRDEGMDVTYTGLRRTPEQIIERALEKKVDVIGLSILSGAHKPLLPRVVDLAREKGLGNTLIIAGGSIPDEDYSHKYLPESNPSTGYGHLQLADTRSKEHFLN